MRRTPKTKYLKHRHANRVRWSQHFLAWLTVQAIRLSTNVVTIFNRLKAGETAKQIELISGKYPTNTAAPTISGTTTQGQTLTAANGTWTGSPTFTRQWKRSGASIAGATAATYVLQAADMGKTITVTVTGTNAVGSLSVTSAGVGPVA